jgi:hypothetical protein
MIFPQFSSEEGKTPIFLQASLMQRPQANSSLSGIKRSTSGAIIIPSKFPHLTHVMPSGTDSPDIDVALSVVDLL